MRYTEFQFNSRGQGVGRVFESLLSYTTRESCGNQYSTVSLEENAKSSTFYRLNQN